MVEEGEEPKAGQLTAWQGHAAVCALAALPYEPSWWGFTGANRARQEERTIVGGTLRTACYRHFGLAEAAAAVDMRHTHLSGLLSESSGSGGSAGAGGSSAADGSGDGRGKGGKGRGKGGKGQASKRRSLPTLVPLLRPVQLLAAQQRAALASERPELLTAVERVEARLRRECGLVAAAEAAPAGSPVQWFQLDVLGHLCAVLARAEQAGQISAEAGEEAAQLAVERLLAPQGFSKPQHGRFQVSGATTVVLYALARKAAADGGELDQYG